MKRIIALLFCLFAFSSTCHAENILTFSELNDPVSKVTWKVLQEAYKVIGIEIQSQELPPERALTESNAGRTDGETNRITGLDKKYSNLIMVPVAVNKVEGVAFTKNISIPMTGWDSLKPYKIGLRRGTKFAEQGTQGMDVTSADDNKSLFLMLNKERFEIAVTSRLAGLTQIKRLQLDGITMLNPPLATFALYHYLHKKHSSLVPAITQALQDMEEDGRIKAIRDEAIAEFLQP